MHPEKSRGVSLKPANFTEPITTLNTKDKVLVRHLTDNGLDNFLASYFAPPYDDAARLDITSIPVSWASVIRKLSLPHIFFYATVLASQDKLLSALTQAREKAADKCLHEFGEFGQLWLDGRPHYTPETTVNNGRWHFPTWDAETKSWLGKVAHSSSTTSRQLLVIYSTKALLDSSVDLGVYKKSFEREVATWDNYLTTETALLFQKFSIV